MDPTKTVKTPVGAVIEPTYDVSDVPPHYDVPTPDFCALDGPVRLDSNESAFGTSKAAQEAYAGCPDLHRYPDIGAKSLREALARHHGLDADRIIPGAGSGEVIHSLGHAYLCPGDEVIFSQRTFGAYNVISRLNGATPVPIPELDWTANPAGMVDAMNDQTRLLCLANPDNPTGTYLDETDVRALLATLPRHAILLHDETYSEFATQSDFPDGLGLVDEFENVVVTRTFSKIFGLAGLRLGWAYASPAIADALRRYKGPFNVSTPSEAAAVAALADTEFVNRAIKHNKIWRERLATEFSKLGLAVPESASNFVMIIFPDHPGKSATDAQKFLVDRNIFLRPLAGWGIPQAIRMTIGTEEENTHVLATLTEFMELNRLVE